MILKREKNYMKNMETNIAVHQQALWILRLELEAKLCLICISGLTFRGTSIHIG